MESGVFRSGKIGDTGEIGKDVDLIEMEQNFFGTTNTDGKKVKKLVSFKNKTF